MKRKVYENLVTYSWVYTDTFGGDPNYSWANKGQVQIPSGIGKRENAVSTKIIKAAAGLTGVRGEVTWHGDEFEFRPYKSATVLLAQYVEDDKNGDNAGTHNLTNDDEGSAVQSGEIRAAGEGNETPDPSR